MQTWMYDPLLNYLTTLVQNNSNEIINILEECLDNYDYDASCLIVQLFKNVCPDNPILQELEKRNEKYSLKFVKFIEHNDWEGETWNFYLQYDGNEHALIELQSILLKDSKYGEDCDFPYELDLSEFFTYEETNVLVDSYSDNGYYPENQIVLGKLEVKPEHDTSGGEIWSDRLYKGGIADLYV